MRIEQWIRFLVENPLLLVVLLGWIAGGIGKIVQRKQKAQAAQRRAPRAATPTGSADAARPRTAEEVAAEMRRILGMEAPPRSEPQREARKEPRPALRREAIEGDRAPTPLQLQRLGRVEIHVDPHVGESVQRRVSPSSGQVSAHVLGTLGGRAPAVRALRGERHRLVALDDLKRAIVLREILDAPRALRGWDR